MTWENMSRMMQATDQMVQTQQVNRIAKDLEGFTTLKSNPSLVLRILDKDKLEANNLGLAKAKKWMAKIFDVFDDEIDGLFDTVEDEDNTSDTGESSGAGPQ